MARTIAEVLRRRIPERLKRYLRPLARQIRLRRARRFTGAPAVALGARRRYAPTAREIVFVSDVPRVREAKLARGLRQRGWRVVLLHGRIPNYDIAAHFDAAVRFHGAEEAGRLAHNFAPVAYHVFSPSGDVVSAHVVNLKPGPMIFDTTDILEANYLGNSRKVGAVRDAIELQRHCLARADGYCARDLQFQLAEKRLGYRRGGRAVFFPEYCWGSAPERTTGSDATIRCVQAGNFGLEKEGEGDWGYLRIASKLCEAGIAFDLYPNWTHFGRSEKEFAAIFSDYYQLAARSELFRIFRPLAADELIARLREYDFGLSLTWAELAGEPLRSFNPNLLRYCTSARIFDYLDAALPVVLDARYRLMHALLRPYGAAIAAGRDFLKDITGRLKPFATPEMKRRAAAASRGLAVERHAHRLARFYERVAADVGISAG